MCEEEVSVADKQRTEIDAVLLEELRRRADELGRTETEVLEEAVRRYLRDRPGTIAELFERVDKGQKERGVEPLSEEEAMRLAVEEQHAWRRERGERAG
jgi:hypothetical protein